MSKTNEAPKGPETSRVTVVSIAHVDTVDCAVKDAKDTRCAICLDVFGTQETEAIHCGHVFHMTCIEQARAFNLCCPLCRTVPPLDVRARARLLRTNPFSSLDLVDDMTLAASDSLYNPSFTDDSSDEGSATRAAHIYFTRARVATCSPLLAQMEMYTDGMGIGTIMPPSACPIRVPSPIPTPAPRRSARSQRRRNRRRARRRARNLVEECTSASAPMTIGSTYITRYAVSKRPLTRAMCSALNDSLSDT